MKDFKMPEIHVCKCREGRTYNKESEICRKCVKAGKTINMLIEKVVDEGTPEMITMLLLSMLVAETEK